MPSYNYQFSTGETGIGNSSQYGSDRAIDLLIAENLLPDGQFNWYSRGGSKFVDKVPQAQRWLQNGDYTVIKFADVIKIYYKDALKYYLKYSYVGDPENFEIGGLLVDSKVGYLNTKMFDCNVGFGIYRGENFDQNNIVNNTFTKIKNLHLTFFLANGTQVGNSFEIDSDRVNFINIGVIAGKTGVQANGILINEEATTQIVDAIYWCGQIISLGIKTDFSMKLYFSSPIGSTTDSKFPFELNSKAGFSNISKYNGGFIIWGFAGAIGFYTASQFAKSVFQADNIRSDLDIFSSSVSDLVSYDNFCCLLPTNQNEIKLIYISYPLRNASGSFYLPHTSSSKIRNLEVIKDYQIRFLILYVDGTFDVVTLFQGDNNNYKFIVSRLSFYDFVGRIIGAYGSKIWFLINDDYQVLDFSSSVYLDNYSDYSIPFININPISYDYKIDILRNFYYMMGRYPTPIQPLFPYTFTPDANVNDVKWGAITIKCQFEILTSNYGSGYTLNIDNSIINNNRTIKVYLDVDYWSIKQSTSKQDFVLSVNFKINGVWTRVKRTSFSYAEGQENLKNKVLEFTVTNKNAVPVVSNFGRNHRYISYNSPDYTFARDLLGNLWVNPEDIHDFLGYSGYLIPYKFVYYDPVFQGNLLYDMPKSPLRINWSKFGSSTSYRNIEKLYVDGDYPQGHLAFDDSLEFASPTEEFGGNEGDRINRWKQDNQKIIPLVDYSNGDCLFKYGGICSFEPFKVWSANTELPKTRNRGGAGGE